MRRSEFLALAATGAGGCASGCALLGRGPVERTIAPLRVSLRSITDVSMGARPFRPSGFRLGRTVQSGKTIIHNYGHGGAGVTLSWGSAIMAVDLANLDLGDHVGVLGGGVIGLTTATILQQRGIRTAVYCDNVITGTSSILAPAQFFPSHAYNLCHVQQPTINHIIEATRRSKEHFAQLSMDPDDNGVADVDNFHISDSQDGVVWDPVIAQMPWLYADFERYDAAATPFPARFTYRFRTYRIDMPVYLNWLRRQYLRTGGEVQHVRFTHQEQLAALPHPVLFNCLGAGAGPLFGDPEVQQISSWVVVVAGSSMINYALVGEGCVAIPRSTSTVLVGPRLLGSPRDAALWSSASRVILASMKVFENMPAQGVLRRGVREDVRLHARTVGPVLC
jgi:D-amino-acid oxidase